MLLRPGDLTEATVIEGLSDAAAPASPVPGSSSSPESTSVTVDSDTSAITITQGSPWEKLKKPLKTVKWTINIGGYTVPVCAVFCMLNLPKGVTPAALSAIINAPMAAEFFEQFFSKVAANFNPKQAYPLFIGFSASGLVVGTLTSITGLQIAQDALQKQLPSWLSAYGKGVFFVNSLTTRCVAWPYALHQLIENITWKLCGKFKPVYTFMKDLESHFLDADIHNIRADSYEEFVEKFYAVLREKGHDPSKISFGDVYSKIETIVQAACVAACQHYFGLFQQLGAEGWSTFSASLAQSCALNFFTALPNSIFYARSAWMFLPALRETARDGYVAIRYYGGDSKLLNTSMKVGAMSILGAAALAGSQVAAWFSGEDMAAEVDRFESARSNGTLPYCVDRPNLSPFDFDTDVNNGIMTTAAGLFCNGLGTLLFAGRHAIHRNIPQYSAMSILRELKGSTTLRWQAFEKKFGEGFIDKIVSERSACIADAKLRRNQSSGGEQSAAEFIYPSCYGTTNPAALAFGPRPYGAVSPSSSYDSLTGAYVSTADTDQLVY